MVDPHQQLDDLEVDARQLNAHSLQNSHDNSKDKNLNSGDKNDVIAVAVK